MMNDHQLDAQLKEMGAEAAKASESQLPRAGQIWFRAQLVRKMRRREHIERPLLVMSGIAVAICLAAALPFAAEMRTVWSGAYVLPLLAATAIAAVATLAWAVWPTAKSNLQR